jgi:hypothetical protein
MVWGIVAWFLSVPRRRRQAQHVDPEVRLELCGMCGRDFVNPVEWEPVGSEQWRLLLRCGECETWRDVTVPNADVERYDVQLQRYADVLATLLNHLDRERMVGQAEAMTIALERGLIDAADFAVGCAGHRNPWETGGT